MKDVVIVATTFLVGRLLMFEIQVVMMVCRIADCHSGWKSKMKKEKGLVEWHLIVKSDLMQRGFRQHL